MKFLTKLFIFIDIMAAICFFLVYGPVKDIRVFWITTSMETLNHKYLAHIFYSNNAIEETLKENYYEDVDEDTDPSKITIGVTEKNTNYESVYEQQILEHEDDELFKLIEFKYKDFNCYLIAVYDPKRVHAAAISNLNKGKILTEISKDNGALAAINGGGYTWSTYLPKGFVVTDGNFRYSQNSKNKYPTAIFNEDGVLIVGTFSKQQVIDKGAKQALSFGPVLITNGKPIKIVGTGGSGMNPRTVLAQRKDGIVLFLVVNGYGQNLSWKGRGGVYLNDLLVILERYGAYNAINMDGGSSTTMVIDNKLINSPCEPQKNGQDFIKSAWIIK